MNVIETTMMAATAAETAMTGAKAVNNCSKVKNFIEDHKTAVIITSSAVGVAAATGIGVGIANANVKKKYGMNLVDYNKKKSAEKKAEKLLKKNKKEEEAKTIEVMDAEVIEPAETATTGEATVVNAEIITEETTATTEEPKTETATEEKKTEEATAPATTEANECDGCKKIA